MRTRIIGLGNPILRDDGVGIRVAQELGRRLASEIGSAEIDIVMSEVGGFSLMEMIAGWDRVIIVDSIQFEGLEPGTVVRIDPADLKTSLRLRSVHEIDLPTVLRLGHYLGLNMPGTVEVFGIQSGDCMSFGVMLTPRAENGMHKAVEMIFDGLTERAMQD